MELPKLKKPDKYVGLYVFDFGSAELAAGGGHAGVGFTAEEVAELLESEKYKNCKVYKIHKAYPDGRLELKGVPAQTFQLEAGMLFYSADLETANKDFKQLVNPVRKSARRLAGSYSRCFISNGVNLAVRTAPPCRAKVHLSKYNDDKFVVALIYPAEYDDEVSSWLSEGEYKTAGAAEGGTDAVQRYYDQKPQILERHQLFGKSAIENKTGEQLLASVKLAVQR